MIREAGDSALLLELGEPVIDPELNARAIAIARAVREQAIPGVRDVVSTFRSVAVFFDPLVSRRRGGGGGTSSMRKMQRRRAWLGGRSTFLSCTAASRVRTWLNVAAFARCTPEAVIERHAGDGLSRVHARIPSGVRLHGARRRDHRRPATGDPARARGGRVGGDRRACRPGSIPASLRAAGRSSGAQRRRSLIRRSSRPHCSRPVTACDLFRPRSPRCPASTGPRPV